jgi:5-methylthioadenosine/S-adenosylhomocysteine deaminase
VGEGGRIEVVGPDARVPRPGDVPVHHYPGAALLPGLVNVHTHLELTGLRGRVPQIDFFAWIQQVRRLKETLTPDAYLEAARQGVREAWRHGVTCVADTGTSGASALALAQLGGRGVVYQEAIAPRPEDAEEALGRLLATVDYLRAEVTPEVIIGISPHAPYTVSHRLYQLIAGQARSGCLPVATHVAESPDEVAFVVTGEGPFAELWRARGLAVARGAPSPVALLEELGLLGPDLLAIHVVQTDAVDLERLRRAGCAVAVCPRSNARHRHGEVPLARYLEAGIRVGLGTDSVASVDDLDLLAEARLAMRLARLDPDQALALATRGGAAALRLDRTIGTLSAGKFADLCVVRVDAAHVGAPAHAARAALEAGGQAVVATYVAGRRVYGGEPAVT